MAIMGHQTARDALITRILNSKAFAEHENPCKLLHYLAKHSGPVPEKTIGKEVFGKGDNFDPRDDSTVRNHKRDLVRDLDAYFLREGKNEAVIVTVVVGNGYGLSYNERQPTLEEVQEALVTEARMRKEVDAELKQAFQKIHELEEQVRTAKMNPLVISEKVKTRRLPSIWLGAIVPILLLVFSIIYIFHLRTRLDHSHPMNVRRMPSVERLWRVFIDAQKPAQLLFSNGKFKGDLDKPIPGVTEDREPGVAGEFTLDSITGVGEVFGVVQLKNLFWSFEREIGVNRPLNFVREDANLVILGGTAENPLLERFRPDRTKADRAAESGIKTTKYFQFCRREDNDTDGRTLCRTESGKLRIVDVTRGPDSGREWQEFIPNTNPEGAPYSKVLKEDYFLIAYVPQEDFPGRSTMLLAGLGTWGTEAAVEFSTNENAVSKLFEALHLDKQTIELPSFEAVVWVGISNGAPRSNYIIKSVKVWPRGNHSEGGSANKSK
jgi:hypothetical protein